MKATRFIKLLLLPIAIGMLLSYCTKDKADPSTQFTNAKLFALAKDSTGHTHLYNNPALFRQPAGNSPHGLFKVRFNKKAQDALVGGKLPVNGTFPDSSLIVKDIYDGINGNITLYAVMYKYKGVWQWAEYKPDGTIAHSIFGSVGVCTSCHSNTPNRDLVRVFDLH